MTSTDRVLQPPVTVAPRSETYRPRHAAPADDRPPARDTDTDSDTDAGTDSRADVEAGRPLDALDPDWRVLPSIPAGRNGSAIDHLAIGPAGVFTIDIKHHPDAAVWVCGDLVKVDRKNERYVRNSRLEAQRMAKLLSTRARFDVDVRGLVAVLGARARFTVKEQPADGMVTVLTHATLAAHLRSLPVVLGPASIARIDEAARDLATWQPQTVEWAHF
jgi:hypothetical protein